MKIWIKLVIGIVLGLLIGYFFPGREQNLEFWAGLLQNIGRYSLFPLLFFSLPLAVLDLRKEKKLVFFYGRSLLYLVASTLILIIFGAVSVILLVPNRIPIIVQNESVLSIPGFRETLLMLFPKNIFQLFSGDGNFLFPVYVFAFFLGLNFSFDRIITRPAVQLFDSFSRIFYHVTTFLVELTGIGLIILSAFWYMQISRIPDYHIFSQTVLLLVINATIVSLAIYPAILYFSCQKENPFRYLYAILTPLLSGFFSANLYFSLPALIHHGKENLGIPRKAGISLFPLFAVFGKAGTALVSGTVFLVIIGSYSSLGIGFLTLLWVVFFSFVASFASGPLPGLGVQVSLIILCRLYGQGIEEGYLIVAPIMPVLLSIAAFLDVLTAGIAVYLAARHEGFTKEVKTRDYI